MIKSALIAVVLTVLSSALSFALDREKTILGIRKGIRMFTGILPSIVTVLILVSLLLYLIPRETILRVLGKDAGIVTKMMAAIIGSLSLIPGFIAYPVCSILVKSGVSYQVIAVFITTLMMVGIVTLPVESRYFGAKAALLRNALSFAAAVIIGSFIGLMWGVI